MGVPRELTSMGASREPTAGLDRFAGNARVAADRGADVVVVGAGVAGLSAALAFRSRAGKRRPRVLLISKRRLGEGGASNWAQGGVAAALAAGDSPVRHAADTLAVSGGIGDRGAVELLTTRGPQCLRELLAAGARFDRDASGELALGREAAHSAARILHAGGDATGAEMVRALTAAVRGADWIELLEETFVEDLLVTGGRVVGVLARRVASVASERAGAGESPSRIDALDSSADDLVPIAAGAVVLATGGIGQAWRFTTNPLEATGDGLAMAARAGARLADLEFMQFHPTALAAKRDPLPLLTEALRGEGAALVDGRGHRFMPAEHPLAELAPRDVVARAIFRRRQRGEEVFLDAREAVGERFPARFPTVFARCREAGIDPRVEPMPVTPAAHYHMGGVAVDLAGRTSIAGLWACGEVASTGAHGANRLASNSLLEALVFGAAVGEDVATVAPQAPDAAFVRRVARAASARANRDGVARGAAARATRDGVARAASARATRDGAAQAAGHVRIDDAAGSSRQHRNAPSAADPDHTARLRARVRGILWDHVGVERDLDGLATALHELDAIAGEPAASQGELRNLVTVGRLVTAAALLREESRGAHWRRDYPVADPGYAHRTLATADDLLSAAARAARPELAASHS